MNRAMWERLVAIDRRWIFLAIGTAVTLPFVLNLTLPTGGVNVRTRNVYDVIARARPRDTIVLAYDFGPSSMPELRPMALALTSHALRRNLRVLALTLNVQGSLIADDVFKEIAARMPEKKDGTDWVNLGFKPGGSLVILGMGDSIQRTFAKDAQGRPTASLPVMRGVTNFSSIRLVVDLASSSTPNTWILFAHERFKQVVAAGVTAVMATDYYPYLATGQLVGMLNGLKGAADYEQLLEHPDKAVLGMTSQSIAHLAIIAFVIIGNIGYFWTRRRR